MPADTTGLTWVGVPTGPEDLLLDETGGRDRLIVSCRDIPAGDSAAGSLVEVDLASHHVRQVFTHPDFRPHGITLLPARAGSKPQLFAISHCSDDVHEVWHFDIAANGALRLRGCVGAKSLEECLRDKGTPNDLVALPGGDLVMTVPGAPPSGRGQKILHYQADRDRWRVLDAGTNPAKYPNGITHHDGTLLIAFSQGHGVWALPEVPAGADPPAWTPVFSDLDGPDNFGGGSSSDRVWLAGHDNLFRFLIHGWLPVMRSPTRLYELDLASGKSREATLSSGARLPIDAASTAVEVDGALWIGQVFGDFLLKVDLDRLDRGKWR